MQGYGERSIVNPQKFFPSLNLNKVRARFSFGAVEDPKWIAIRTAIIQTGFCPYGAGSPTRLDLVGF